MVKAMFCYLLLSVPNQYNSITSQCAQYQKGFLTITVIRYQNFCPLLFFFLFLAFPLFLSFWSPLHPIGHPSSPSPAKPLVQHPSISILSPPQGQAVPANVQLLSVAFFLLEGRRMLNYQQQMYLAQLLLGFSAAVSVPSADQD